MTTGLSRVSFSQALHAEAAPTAAGPAIDDAEIVEAAQRMSLAGAGAASGMRLLSVLLDERLDLPGLAKLVSAQPGIALRVMRVANSAYYGHSGVVATVDRAAQVLGLTALRGIAAAACFEGLTAPVAGSATLDLAAFRNHSLAVACAAQALAQRVAQEMAGEAFMAGLLHDIGLVVLWRLRPQSLLRHAAGRAGRGGLCVAAPQAAEQERLALGTTHAHCGRVALAAWHLPAGLVDAVAEHDLPAAAGDRPATAPLAALLRLADHLACAAGHAFDPDHVPVPPDERVLAQHGITPEQLAEVAAALPDTVKRLCAVFED
ncbi:MAG TPA: HDOD domain-containing protein [Ideonella sp.]|nr:HDOD domain-containing protein [Ideonella sp.]